jgi:hypothetical protein
MNLEVEREEVVQALCAHYAQDHLTTGELEARVEQVYRAGDRNQLRTLIDGLPAIRPVPALAQPMYAVAEPTPRGLAPDERRYAAIFAETKKEGAWTPTRRIDARAIFGSVLLDFREVQIPAEGIDIEAEVMFGEVNIFLPPGIGADVDCTSMLATVEDKVRPGALGAPRIRVTGGAVFGSIVVKTKLPRKEKLESWRAQLKQWLG